MPRGRKKQVILTTEEQLAAIEAKIAETTEALKVLRQQKKEIEDKMDEEKKEKLYQVVLASGKSIDEVLNMLSE